MGIAESVSYLGVSDAKVKRPRCRACLQISAKNKHYTGRISNFYVKDRLVETDRHLLCKQVGKLRQIMLNHRDSLRELYINTLASGFLIYNLISFCLLRT